MNCATHADTPAVAFCRTCGKALCSACRQEWRGVIYCGACMAASQQSAVPMPPRPVVAPPTDAPSPGLAFALGFIPGVGAIYNGQYGKGIVHVVVLGLLISIVSSDAAGSMGPLFGILIAAWFFYMAFEAYHTAKKRLAGEPVDEFSGLLRSHRYAGRVPAGPIVLILLGVVFLLNTLDYLRFERVARYWPVLLIAAGVYMLYLRLAGGVSGAGPGGPPSTPSSSISGASPGAGAER